MLVQKHQGIQQLNREPIRRFKCPVQRQNHLTVSVPSNEPHTETLKVVALDKVIQVDTEALKSNA